MLTFAICPHDTETKEDLQFWAKIAQQLADRINQRIKLITFKSFLDERTAFTHKKFDLYYTNAIIAYKLCTQGYLPVAKFKNSFDNFVLIGYNKFVETSSTITTLYLETHILPLLYLKEFDFLYTSIRYVPTQQDVYITVKEGNADFGIMFKKDYERIEDEQKIPIIKEMPTRLSHYLMVKPKHYDTVKHALEDNKKFEIVSKKDFLNSLSITFRIDSILKIKEFYDISKIVHEIPFVGIFIYRDKILYANKYFQNMLGYSLEEIRNLSVEELVSQEYRQQVQDIVRKRLQGKLFALIHKNIKVKTKSGSYRKLPPFVKTTFLNLIFQHLKLLWPNFPNRHSLVFDTQEMNGTSYCCRK